MFLQFLMPPNVQVGSLWFNIHVGFVFFRLWGFSRPVSCSDLFYWLSAVGRDCWLTTAARRCELAFLACIVALSSLLVLPGACCCLVLEIS